MSLFIISEKSWLGLHTVDADDEKLRWPNRVLRELD